MHDRANRMFNDGVARIYAKFDSSDPGETPTYAIQHKITLRYKELTVGIYRFAQHKQIDARIDRLIRCPRSANVSTHDIVDLDGAYVDDVRRYYIRQIQYPDDVQPPCMDLSLEQIASRHKFDGGGRHDP